jgi:hypothetical protein
VKEQIHPMSFGNIINGTNPGTQNANAAEHMRVLRRNRRAVRSTSSNRKYRFGHTYEPAFVVCALHGPVTILVNGTHSAHLADRPK